MSAGARRARRVWLIRAAWAVAALAVIVLVLPNAWILAASAGRVSDYGEDGDTAEAPVAIVLGASVWAPGEPSPWLKYRLETAAGLYESGRVDAILVSGDNSRVDYDEPTAMRDYLVGLGVPSEAIALDYAGFDTYDTCVRARRIFGVDQALLVSQDFHVSRAVALRGSGCSWCGRYPGRGRPRDVEDELAARAPGRHQGGLGRGHQTRPCSGRAGDDRGRRPGVDAGAPRVTVREIIDIGRWPDGGGQRLAAAAVPRRTSS